MLNNKEKKKWCAWFSNLLFTKEIVFDCYNTNILLLRLQFFRHYNNAFYARVGGVSKLELNRLELELLFLLDFGVAVSSRVFESYCFHLEKEMMLNDIGHTIEKAIIPSAVEYVTEISVEDTQSSSPPQLLDWPALFLLLLSLGLANLELCKHGFFLVCIIVSCKMGASILSFCHIEGIEGEKRKKGKWWTMRLSYLTWNTNSVQIEIALLVPISWNSSMLNSIYELMLLKLLHTAYCWLVALMFTFEQIGLGF